MPQVQGNLWINDREWCDFISFDPRIDGDGRLFIKRIYRDETYIKNLERRVFAFIQKLESVLLASCGIAWEGVTKEAE